MTRKTIEKLATEMEMIRYMATHAMAASASNEILASIAISGRRPTDAEITNLVWARTKDAEIARMIRSKIEDVLTIAEALRAAGTRG